MSFYFKGYDNRGYFVEIPAGLAVVEGFVDSITVPWDVSVPNITYGTFAITEPNDVWASAGASVTTFLDMAVVGPVDDVAIFGLVIADILDFSVNEANDVFAGLGIVSTTLGFDLTEDDDIWFSTGGAVLTPATFAVTDRTDTFLGHAFVGYFFLPEQEILYVASENTVMRVPANTSVKIRIAPKPIDLETLDVDTTMITKKRNRSRLQ
jgi:hypothetical protein